MSEQIKCTFNVYIRVNTATTESYKVLLRYGVAQGDVSHTLLLHIISDLTQGLPNRNPAAISDNNLWMWYKETRHDCHIQNADESCEAEWSPKWCVALNKNKFSITQFNLSPK